MDLCEPLLTTLIPKLSTSAKMSFFMRLLIILLVLFLPAYLCGRVDAGNVGKISMLVLFQRKLQGK